MSTAPTPTHRPINLAGARWSVGSRTATFGAARPGFGVLVVATGEILSRDGVTPSTWSTKAIASVVAANPPACSTVKIEVAR